VVTNVEADHLDIYADLADITTTFATYVRRARYVVLCADDPGANALPSPATAEVIRYGIMSPDARLVAREIRHHDGGSTFTVVYDGKPRGAVHLGVPGRHNVLNALAALACGIGPWGLTVEAMAPGSRALRRGGAALPAEGERTWRDGGRRLRASSHRGGGDAGRWPAKRIPIVGSSSPSNRTSSVGRATSLGSSGRRSPLRTCSVWRRSIRRASSRSLG